MSDRLGPYVLDPSVRRHGPGGRVLLGGSPLRLLRLTAAGAQLVDHLAAGDTVRSTRGVRAVLDRLVAAGVAHPVPPPPTDPVAADVTVVVPVRDHAPQLARLLDSLGRCRPAPVRVVVVDDGSAEPVGVRPRRSGSLAVELVRRERSGGPAAARNTGLAAVRTPLVAFVDADCVVDRDWLGPLLAQLADPAVALVAPRVRAAPGVAPGPLVRHDRDASPLDLGPLPARVGPGTAVTYVPSAALLARTDALVGLGGFDESLRVGEDVDLVWRLVDAGHVVRYEPRSAVHHEVRPDLRRWLLQRYRYGTSAAALDERHPGRVAPVVCSPSSAAVWGLVALGHPLAAAAVAAATVEGLRRRLGDVPLGEVARVALGGHLAAGAQLARTSVRDWWPATLAASLVARRARRLGLICWVASTAAALRHRAAPLDHPLAFVALRTADGLAYGAGVWAGALRRRRPGALLPTARSVGRRRVTG